MPEIVNDLKFCDNCGKPITYEKDEVFRLNEETVGFVCPNCGNNVIVDFIKTFTFPDSFYHFGVSEGGVKLTQKETQQYINHAKLELRNNLKSGEYCTFGSGDTIVIGMKCDDEDVIVVAKDYWEEHMVTE